MPTATSYMSKDIYKATINTGNTQNTEYGADSLSRLPLKKLDKTTSGHVCEEYVKFVVESDVSDTASAVYLRDVKKATANDPFMSELYKLIELGE